MTGLGINAANWVTESENQSSLSKGFSDKRSLIAAYQNLKYTPYGSPVKVYEVVAELDIKTPGSTKLVSAP